MCHAAVKLQELSGLECKSILIKYKMRHCETMKRKFEKCIKCTF